MLPLKPRPRPHPLVLLALALVSSACGPGNEPSASGSSMTSLPVATTASTTTTTTSTTTTTTTMAPTYPLEGRIFGHDGEPLRDVTVRVGDAELVTGASGVFTFDAAPAGVVEITRPAYKPVTVEWDGSQSIMPLTLEPIVSKALRAEINTVRSDEKFASLLELAAATAVDALVFDTKKEGGVVLYDTRVDEAHEIGAVVESTYDPVKRIEQAKEAGLYTITRIVSFEDPIRSKARPEYRLAGDWIDPLNRDTWEYMLDLGVEACDLGFDEVQFDYVRFPTGAASRQARERREMTEEQRVGAIAEFLTEARDRLHPMGCAVGAAIFAIVFSAPNDQGIGQRPEDLSGVVDVISPMIYPSHYSNGWLGFDDPNDYPGEVTADALDDGMPRVGGGTLIRPWLQAFYWTDAEILESIRAAERRGLGWMLWNAVGNYPIGSLPSPEDADEGAAEDEEESEDDG